MKCASNLYSLIAKSGTYYFEVRCDVPINDVILKRQVSENKRDPKAAIVMIVKFSSLVAGEEAEDLEIIKQKPSKNVTRIQENMEISRS